MENLQIDKETAKKIYPTAPAEIKLILEQTFGKGFFSENIMDKVKSVEDAIAIFGDSHEEVIKLNKLIRTFGIGDNLTKYQMLKIVRDVLNEGWVPDWDNKNEHKWYPYYNSVNGKFTFSTSYYYTSDSNGGLYLCFHSEALSLYFGNVAEFTQLYNEFIFKCKTK